MSDPIGTQLPAPHFFVDISLVINSKRAMLAHHKSQIELMKHMHKIDDFFGYVLEGNRHYGKIAGVDYAEAYWQHKGGGFQEDPQIQEDISEYIIEKKQ
jgi:hypothetical protein